MLVSEAISQAYRDSNITVLGAEPTAAEVTEGLNILNNFWRALLGYEFGENLDDWPVPAPSDAPGVPDSLVSSDLSSTFYTKPIPNSRLLVTLTAAATVYFPRATDGARMAFVDVGSSSVNVTLNGNGRLIEGSATLVDTPAQFNGREWFYRADLASWQLIETLDENDNLPLPADFDDLFITYMSIRLGGRHAPASDETKEIFSNMMRRAKSRYRQSQATAVADPRISESQQAFNNGVDWFS